MKRDVGCGEGNKLRAVWVGPQSPRSQVQGQAMLPLVSQNVYSPLLAAASLDFEGVRAGMQVVKMRKKRRLFTFAIDGGVWQTRRKTNL